MSEQSFASKKSLYTITGWLMIAESLLIFVPLTILGSAINWPKSLSEPADKILPLLIQNASAVRFGYLVYLVYSILFGVIALLVTRTLNGEKSDSIWLPVASGFGIASMTTRCLGIIRWLVAMPALAALYADSTIPAATHESIAVIYHALNEYAGSVGEMLGVSLFAGLWLAIVSMRILRTRILPKWLGVLGLMSAILLAVQLTKLFGVDLGAFISISVSILHVWFLAMGIVLIRWRQQKY